MIKANVMAIDFSIEDLIIHELLIVNFRIHLEAKIETVSYSVSL